ncbi:MAG: Gfo/Idh/MocA family protein, partial [Omnitrophica WOR_2 bacterium]
MNNPTKVKIAVIGVGTMGSCHARDICQLGNARLEAVCDIIPERAQQYGEMLGVKAFSDYREMLDQAEVEAVVIATPHYFHTPISIDCFDRGIHVMTEKPVAVHVNDARKMIAAYEKALEWRPGLKFGIMFQQRTHTFWRKIKEMIDQGELGHLVRATWIITDWFRTQYYYDHGDWRATWKGEGGGVLLNQCPHNLDLYQWFFGMPKRIAGYASIGKYHHIEVEDEVTGYFEHENGMVGHFITTTAESPGTNRLEIAGEKGKLIFEDGRLVFYRNLSSMFDFIKEHQDAWDKVEFQLEEINFEEANQPGHLIVLE